MDRRMVTELGDTDGPGHGAVSVRGDPCGAGGRSRELASLRLPGSSMGHEDPGHLAPLACQDEAGRPMVENTGRDGADVGGAEETGAGLDPAAVSARRFPRLLLDLAWSRLEDLPYPRGAYAFQQDPFATRPVTRPDRHGAPGYPEPFGQEGAERLIGGSLDRRRGDSELQCPPMHPGVLRARRVRLDMHAQNSSLSTILHDRPHTC